MALGRADMEDGGRGMAGVVPIGAMLLGGGKVAGQPQVEERAADDGDALHPSTEAMRS